MSVSMYQFSENLIFSTHIQDKCLKFSRDEHLFYIIMLSVFTSVIASQLMDLIGLLVKLITSYMTKQICMRHNR